MGQDRVRRGDVTRAAPDYYGKNVGPRGRRWCEELMDVVRDMGARWPRDPTRSW